MKKLFFCLGFLFVAPALQAAPPPSATHTINGIVWYTNYDQALAEANAKNLPMLLVFEGSDWCGWCKKLDSEVLHTQEFANIMGDRMVFVNIDFPRNPSSQEQAAANERLKQKFGVTGFPTVIILDSQGRRLSNMGYMPGGPRSYAQHIEAVIDR